MRKKVRKINKGNFNYLMVEETYGDKDGLDA
jgi:hypothetical protein